MRPFSRLYIGQGAGGNDSKSLQTSKQRNTQKKENQMKLGGRYWVIKIYAHASKNPSPFNQLRPRRRRRIYILWQFWWCSDLVWPRLDWASSGLRTRGWLDSWQGGRIDDKFRPSKEVIRGEFDPSSSTGGSPSKSVKRKSRRKR